MANITAYSDILVVDMVGGIITGAVAERLGGTSFPFSFKGFSRGVGGWQLCAAPYLYLPSFLCS